MLKQACVALLLVAVASAAAAENLPYDQAKEAGVVRCLTSVKKVATFLHDDKNHGAHSTWSRANPDKTMFTSTIERTYADGAGITSLFAVPVATGCAIAYERVLYFDKTCLALARDTFADFQFSGTLNKLVTVFEKKSGGAAYLMSAGSGCIAVRKESMLDGEAR